MKLFAVPVQVLRLEKAEMPSHMFGASLICYVSAADHLTALRLAVEALKKDHYQFTEMAGKISELDPQLWDKYVKATWPEAVSSMPEQKDLLQLLDKEAVFYGPFCGYDSKPFAEKIMDENQANGPTIRYARREEVRPIIDKIFKEHAELFRRLAE